MTLLQEIAVLIFPDKGVEEKLKCGRNTLL